MDGDDTRNGINVWLITAILLGLSARWGWDRGTRTGPRRTLDPEAPPGCRDEPAHRGPRDLRDLLDLLDLRDKRGMQVLTGGHHAATKIVSGTQHVSPPPNPPVGTAVTGLASCPANYVLLSGGGRVGAVGAVADRNVTLRDSVRTESNDLAGGWHHHRSTRGRYIQCMWRCTSSVA